MTRDEVLRLAREAGIPVGITGGNPSVEQVERFAKLIEEAGETKRLCADSHGDELTIAYMAGAHAGRRISDDATNAASRDVLAERRRQIEIEGWTLERDDQNKAGDMARAAACYALHAAGYPGDDVAMLRFWPWLDSWWRPTTSRRDLVKAAALILAEIERLDRADQKEGGRIA